MGRLKPSLQMRLLARFSTSLLLKKLVVIGVPKTACATLKSRLREARLRRNLAVNEATSALKILSFRTAL